MLEFSWLLEAFDEVFEPLGEAHERVSVAQVKFDVAVVRLNFSLVLLNVVGDGDVGVEACAGTLAYANLCVVGSAAADGDAADAHRVVVGVGCRCA